MGARDLVTVDPQKFEELLDQNKLNVQQAAEAWGIARASLQKIRARTPISKALASKIMLKARAKDSILVLQDKHSEDILVTHLNPFFKQLVRPGDQMKRPGEYSRKIQIEVVPDNIELLQDDSDSESQIMVYWLTDLVRLQKCDDTLLAQLSKKGRHFSTTPSGWTGDPTWEAKNLDAVWHCVEDTYLSNKAIENLKSLREILSEPRRANKIGATLNDIIEAGTSQSGLAEVIENLEDEGIAIFAQRVSTLLPLEIYRHDLGEDWQGVTCNAAEHGFLVISESEFDAVELKYSRWVSAALYRERMSIAEIEQLNKTDDLD